MFCSSKKTHTCKNVATLHKEKEESENKNKNESKNKSMFSLKVKNAQRILDQPSMTAQSLSDSAQHGIQDVEEICGVLSNY